MGAISRSACSGATRRMAELQTERLLLRQWRPEDRAPFAGLTSDPNVMLYFPSLLTREESDELADAFEHMIASRGWGMWALEERATGSFVGFTGVVRPRFDASFMQVPEIGWRLVRAAWGHGFATEAARAAATYAFGELMADEILALASIANQRSRAVMERIGMCRDRSHDFEYPLAERNGVRHHVLYRLTPDMLLTPASHGDRSLSSAGWRG